MKTQSKKGLLQYTLQIKTIDDFDQLVSERTELSKPVLSIRDWMDYEDKNFHTENLVRLIIQHGSDEDKIAIADIYLRTEALGEITGYADYEDRYQLYQKYSTHLNGLY